MDLELLIKEAMDDKANSVSVELPSFEDIWENASRHKRILPGKRFNLEKLSIAEWLEIAVILVMLFILPTITTSIRNSPSAEIKPGSNQAVISSTDIENAKKAGMDFLTKLNTFSDYKTFKEIDSILYPNDSRTKSFRNNLTDDYYQDFVANRDSLLIPKTCSFFKCSVKPENVTLSKYTEDPQNKQIVFNFETTSKFIQEETSKEKLVTVTGQITIKEQDGTWKIKLYYPRSSDPKDWFNMTNTTW